MSLRRATPVELGRKLTGEGDQESGLFTSHSVDGIGNFYMATDGKAHDEMHVGIRDGSQFTHASVRYILSRLQPRDRFVDVGANLGTYTIPAAAKGCHVLAIEALPQNYALLCQSVVKNGLTNVIPVHAAAYDTATTVEMTGTSAWGTISDRADGIMVPALTLDDLLSIHGFGAVDLLKMDIEGAESVALDGLKRHLAEGLISEIVVEVNEQACRAAGYSGEALLRILHDTGFHLYMLLGNQIVPRRFDDFRELYNCDFLATRRPLEKAVAGFEVEELPLGISVAHVLAQAESPFEPCRFYIANNLDRAPPAIRDDPRVRAALSKLRDDPLLVVRDAARVTLAALPSSSPLSSALPVRTPGVDRSDEIKIPMMGGVPSSQSVLYRNRNKRIAVLAPQAAYCGVAHYGRNFCRNLARAGFQAELVPFDDELMRRTQTQYVAFGDAEIAAICEKLETYDICCFEFEPGTLGGNNVDIARRLRRLMKIKTPVVIDFHTVDRPPPINAKTRLKFVLGLLPRRRHWRHEYRHIATWRGIYEAVREREKAGDLAAIVHTVADHEYFTKLLGLTTVEHHPLAYFDESDRAEIIRQMPRRRRQLERRLKLDSEDFILGVFGFIAPHKGTHHAIEALAHLPENYKLAIFGQHHPTNIPTHRTDPYLDSLVKRIEEHGLSERVFFIGDLADNDFSAAFASVDLAVFPYHEVGQRSSGPIQMAIDIGMPILCSRTYCFQALAQYYPDRLRFFDIGNHLQLAQLVSDVGEGRLEGIPGSAQVEFTTHSLVAQFDDLLGRLNNDQLAVRPQPVGTAIAAAN